MVFPSRGLTPQLKESLNAFLETQDFPELYKAYKWKKDTYLNGFPDIAGLETRLRSKTMNNTIELQDLIAIAKWGGLRNINRINLTEGSIMLNLYQEDRHPLLQLAGDPLSPLISLQRQVTGLGPTYLTKTLRFALAQEYGAIDTRIVRVVGQGDIGSKQQDWLKLKARNDGYGWYISKSQSSWPSGYARWINILRFFANKLNNAQDPCPCPHPAKFVDSGLRVLGSWSCADIEMAVFSYASQSV